MEHMSLGQALGGIILLASIVGGYWLPTLVAAKRDLSNTGPIALVNGLVGWTFVGWVIALVMACRPKAS